MDVWTKRADGSGTAERVLDREEDVFEARYSPDSTLIFRQGDGRRDGLGDIYSVQPGSDSRAEPLVNRAFAEISPALSPDGRWLAYVSDASGRDEIYVRPFPDVDSGLVQVSTAGGVQPLWAHGGRELFYRNSSELVAVEVATEPMFVPGRQEELFSTAGYLGGGDHPLYDLTPDDQRFVFLLIGGDVRSTQLILVENWFEELRGRLGN